MGWVREVLEAGLLEGPLLVGDLPGAPSLSRESLRPSTRVDDPYLEQKLGHLIEDVMTELIEGSEVYELLARNLQIRRDRHETLGELDFLIRDLRSCDLVHLEIATKFYLAVESESGLCLPGPDPRDNYWNKLQHLQQKQLTIAERFRDELPSCFHGERILPRQLVFGCLFDHVEARNAATPEHSNPSARRGYWLRSNELDYFQGNPRFEIIPKYLWPVPLDLFEDRCLEEWQPRNSLNTCVMVRVEGWREPFFVAPPAYPYSR